MRCVVGFPASFQQGVLKESRFFHSDKVIEAYININRAHPSRSRLSRDAERRQGSGDLLLSWEKKPFGEKKSKGQHGVFGGLKNFDDTCSLEPRWVDVLECLCAIPSRQDQDHGS